jgi:hypothetical protein
MRLSFQVFFGEDSSRKPLRRWTGQGRSRRSRARGSATLAAAIAQWQRFNS